MQKTVAILGGGLGGLAAAAWLAKSGATVHLFEKNNVLGGRMQRFQFNGYTFDAGPVMLTLPGVVDELFQHCGYERQEFLQIQTLDPIFRYFFYDGSMFESFSDMDALKFQISKLPESNIRNFVDFINYSKKLYQIFSPELLYQPLTSQNPLKTKLFWKFVRQLRHLDAFTSVHNKTNTFFKNSALQQIFDRYNITFGSNPLQAPALLNMFPWIEYGFGSYTISGGMFQLVEALENLLRHQQVHIHTNASVQQIFTHHGRVEAVQVAGEKIPVDAIISNIDPLFTQKKLLGMDNPHTKKLQKNILSPAPLVFLWGVRGETRRFEHLNLVLPEDIQAEYRQLFDQQQLPQEPTIQVAISSKQDSTQAPHGCENWVVMLRVPNEAGQNWPAIIESLRGVLFSRLKNIDVDLHGRIAAERVLTPAYYQSNFNSLGGNAFGITLNSLGGLWQRQANKCTTLQGLYFAGSSVHPGSGIPLCLLSGKMAAQLAQQYLLGA